MSQTRKLAYRGPSRLTLARIGVAALLAACSGPESTQQQRDDLARSIIEQKKTTADGTSTATTADGYKQDLAKRISQVNFTSVYVERPQALLRSVIVVKYVVDRDGNLVNSEILRSNRDKQAEASALGSLKNTAPFPKPPEALLRHGRIELSESWLFNNDGRFQLRSVALAQMGE
ncbi:MULTISPECIES: TonB family protein [unclassified Herbaspirillum]|uniref:TonB family protein n=1 Tax=unclassified Herbaspirillum TaxID=2624150 RepID=UPI0011510A1B|nr:MULTISPECIES: TonB family protein [unclassified Herbaspirillum]MBB5393170.1 protein TonB [Herbaspirillum sp. SJZ102]TQK04189.1 protein TonB [Herbaspirillum sp. SJZ130]TQK10026.1 protein TonB [Herbaspirillum sp. SJZ106]TWC63598.1 protein TonB [Herbaspirillum sp. SJZ099]